jgi:hypothetical protein
MEQSMWRYRDPAVARLDLEGYTASAVDGQLGVVAEGVEEDGDAFLWVDMGTRLFGQRALVPAGLVDLVDAPGRTLRVNCTVAQVRHAPEIDPAQGADVAYRERLADYYAGQLPPSADVTT